MTKMIGHFDLSSKCIKITFIKGNFTLKSLAIDRLATPGYYHSYYDGQLVMFRTP